MHGNTLQHTAAHCSTLQHTAEHCRKLHHTAAHYPTPPQVATLCNTPQHFTQKPGAQTARALRATLTFPVNVLALLQNFEVLREMQIPVLRLFIFEMSVFVYGTRQCYLCII